MRLGLALGLVVCSGCGAGTMTLDGGDDGGVADLATVDLAQPAADLTVALPNLPQVDGHGAMVLSKVQLVTVTFTGYAFEAEAQQFGDFIVASDWYKKVGADYGVGVGTHLKKVVLTDDPGMGITDLQVQALLKARIMDATLPPPPKADDQVLYMVYFPSTTTVNQPGGDAACSSFAGYHGSTTYVAGGRILYAVIADCGGGIDDVTSTAAHELIEAATDPVPELNGRGWYVDPVDDFDHWQVEWGQEVADLCEEEGYQYEQGYALQPVWSNSAAAALMNPCVPSASTDYYTVTAQPATMPTVAAGDSVTFVLTGWSTKLVPPWKIELATANFSDYFVTDLQPVLSAGTIGRGATVTLKLTAPSVATSGDLCGVQIRSGPDFHRAVVGFYVQ
jgi:hypothetical protein